MRVIPVLLVCCCVPSLAAQAPSSPEPCALDFSETVIPITAFKVGIGPKISYKPTNPLSYIGVQGRGEFGTGFCIDPACRFIGTNYHVVVMTQPRKVGGEKVVQQYLATGPDDEGATVNEGLSRTKFNLSRDLAIFELARPLPHHRGIAYNLDGLDDGQEVEIYAYPKESINPIRHLLQFHGRYRGETTTGLLAFEYGSVDNKTIRPGASGGIVVDRKTRQIVGILSGIAKNGEAIALAVPIQSLAEFVSKVQPFLAESIFPHINVISPVSADLYPKFVLPPADALERRPEEPVDVKLLRSKAQVLADGMRNFIAVQTLAWGSGHKEPVAEAAFEVQVIDGYQRFREYPDGKKEFQDLPLPSLNTAVGTGGEWAELPQMVGRVPRYKIHQFPDAVVNGRRIKVFQYHAEVEDEVCNFKSMTDFVFFTTSKSFTASCYGEVWTDEDTNILRVSEHYESLFDKWKDYQGVVTYGWLKLPDESTRLVPLTIYTQAEHKKRIYYCRGQFTNYRVFDSQVKITPIENAKAGLPQ